MTPEVGYVPSVDAVHMADRTGLLTALMVCDNAGATYRQVEHWTRRGWLLTETPTGGGSGYAHLYAPSEAKIARALARLWNAGVGVNPVLVAAVREVLDTGDEVEIATGLSITPSILR